jgi:hypothetical protein
MVLLFFWVVTPCGLVGRCQCFGGTKYIAKSFIRYKFRKSVLIVHKIAGKTLVSPLLSISEPFQNPRSLLRSATDPLLAVA